LSDLIVESFDQYEKKRLNIKLWYRFWQAIEMYSEGASYQQVLQTLFGAKQTSTPSSHKKNKNFNTLI
jgi:hypothetical protein